MHIRNICIEWSWGRDQHKLFDYFRAHLGNDLYEYYFYIPAGLLVVTIDFDE
ncbi:MAG: hypothetical protein ACREXU_15730 [Gammaproteobacteria bacterium]